VSLFADRHHHRTGQVPFKGTSIRSKAFRSRSFKGPSRRSVLAAANRYRTDSRQFAGGVRGTSFKGFSFKIVQRLFVQRPITLLGSSGSQPLSNR
jgi:hypothetical protein